MLPSAVVRGRRNPLHYGFPRRLGLARKAADMSRSALSLAVAMDRGTASELEAGDRVPRVDTVERLAKVLRVSPCYLAFGLGQPCDPVADSLSLGLSGRLLQIRQERGFSRRELGRQSDTSDNFVYMTETASTVPNIAKVEQLADALGLKDPGAEADRILSSLDGPTLAALVERLPRKLPGLLIGSTTNRGTISFPNRSREGDRHQITDGDA